MNLPSQPLRINFGLPHCQGATARADMDIALRNLDARMSGQFTEGEEIHAALGPTRQGGSSLLNH